MADHRRFFVPPENVKDGTVTIAGETARQIMRVLRLQAGDGICVLDGAGFEHEAEILSVTKEEVTARIKNSKVCDVEPSLRLSIAVALPRSERMDLIVQKGTELGICECIVMDSERVVARPVEQSFRRKLSRWRRIAAEAAEQSGRARIPEIRGQISLSDLASEVRNFDAALVAWEEERETSIGTFLRERRGAKSVLAVIGPEGGLTGGEVEILRNAGAVPVSLGRRILRTETAAIVVCAVVMYELDGGV